MRVLLADDDLELRALIAEAVVAMGADVVCASSGGQLEHELAGPPFDLVVTDVSMPERTGLEVMQSARSSGSACPIVIMTALRDDRTVSQVAALGAHVTLIHKPFSLRAFRTALQSCLGEASEPAAPVEPTRSPPPRVV